MEMNKPGFLYMIDHPFYPGCIKVGIETSPGKRLIDANCWDPMQGYECVYREAFVDPRKVERFLQYELKDYRIHSRREWFRLEPLDVLPLLRRIRRQA